MKYRNTKCNGYDSKKEYLRAIELKQLAVSGIITDLREQVTFELIPNQYRNGKLIERKVCYKADFVYYKDGLMVVEDVKGFKTKDYIIKRILMLSVHGVVVVEV